jgi:hypothetical protein
MQQVPAQNIHMGRLGKAAEGEAITLGRLSRIGDRTRNTSIEC